MNGKKLLCSTVVLFFALGFVLMGCQIDEVDSGLVLCKESGRYATYSITDYKGAASSLVIPETYGGVPITRIGDGAFRGNATLKSITIPKIISTIGDNAFNSCSALTSIVIPSGVKHIGERAFLGCANLESITISAFLEQVDVIPAIGVYAFLGCDKLATVTIDEDLWVTEETYLIDYASTVYVRDGIDFLYEFTNPPTSGFEEKTPSDKNGYKQYVKL